MADVEKPPTGKFFMVVRVTNIVTALVLIGFGIAGIIFMAVHALLNAKFFLVFSPIFMILFGLVLIAAEFKIKMQLLLQHMGFLRTLIGRGIFDIYLASSVFFYFDCGDDSTVVAWVSAIVIFCLGVVSIILHFCGGSGYQQELKEQMI